MMTRRESDSIGTMDVPEKAYYGVQTLRAKNNFKITGRPLHPEFIKNLARIKKAAAYTNMAAHVLDEEKGNAIVKACDEIIAGKLHNHAAVGRRGNKAVVLLGGDAGHRLEPVREVRGAFFDRPVFHGIGHDTRGIVIETLALFHRRLHLPVGLLRQPLAHNCVVKYHRAKNVRDLIHFPGPLSMFQNLCQQRKNGTGARRS